MSLIASDKNSWETKRLRFLARINKSRIPQDLEETEEVSFVPMPAIGEYGGLCLTERKLIEDIGAGYTPFVEEDVLVAKITPCFENGKGAVARRLINSAAYGTTELHVVSCGPELLPDFAFYLSISAPFRGYGEGSMYGAGGQKRVPESFIKDFPVAIPPLAQQKRILGCLEAKLGEIDDLISKKQAMLKLLAERRSALITRAVTKGLNPDAPMKSSGIDWLGDIPAHWEVLPVRRLSQSVKTGGTPSSSGPDFFSEGTVPWFTPGDFGDLELPKPSRLLRPEAFEDGSLSLFPAESVLLVGIGATLGKVGYSSEICSSNQQINAIETNERIRPLFLTLFLNVHLNEIRMLASSSTLPILNQQKTKSLMICVPSVREQGEIISYLWDKMNELEASKSLIEKAITGLLEYRSAIITKAVTGELEVA